MITSARVAFWRYLRTAALAATAPAHAAEPAVGAGAVSAPAAVTSLDPALQGALSRMAASLLTSFAASIASGSAPGFDPGPAIEKTLRGVVASGELDLVIDRLAGQALAAGSGAAKDLSPELRAALALAARSLVSGMRREIQRELATP